MVLHIFFYCFNYFQRKELALRRTRRSVALLCAKATQHEYLHGVISITMFFELEYGLLHALNCLNNIAYVISFVILNCLACSST